MHVHVVFYCIQQHEFSVNNILWTHMDSWTHMYITSLPCMQKEVVLLKVLYS